MNKKKVICIIGSLVSMGAVFAPIVGFDALGDLGDITHIQDGGGDGIIVFIFAILSLLLGLFGRYRWLWLTGLGSLAIIGFTYSNFQAGMSDPEGNPFLKLAEFKWGWIPLVLGSVLILVSAALKGPKKEVAAVETEAETPTEE